MPDSLNAAQDATSVKNGTLKAEAVMASLSELQIHNYPDRNNLDYTIHFDIEDPVTHQPVVQGIVDAHDVDGPWTISLFGGRNPVESVKFNDVDSLKNLMSILKNK